MATTTDIDKPTLSQAEYVTTRIRVQELAKTVHRLNQRWWYDPKTKTRLDRNVGEMLCLVHSEISEALEGHRKDKMDEHLPHRKSIEVELADAMIRILDIAEGLKLDIARAFVEKLEYNCKRKDHTFKGRTKKGGKKY